MASITVGLLSVKITNDKGQSLDLSLTEWLGLLTGIKGGTYDPPPTSTPVTLTSAAKMPKVKPINARPTYTGANQPTGPDSGQGRA